MATDTSAAHSKDVKGWRRKSAEAPVIRWLRAGAVVAGVGAALATGHGVAVADGTGKATDAGSDTSTNAPSTDKPESSTAHPARSPRSNPRSRARSSEWRSGHRDRATDASTDESKHSATDGPDISPTATSSTTVTSASDSSRSSVSAQVTTTGGDDTKHPVIAFHDLAKPPNSTGPRFARRSAVRPALRADDVNDGSAPDSVDDPQTATTPKVFAVTAKTATLNAFSATAATPANVTTTPSYPAQVTATPVTWQSIVSDVFNWAGLGTLASNTNIPAAPVNDLVQAVWLGVRRVHYTFLNSYPGAVPTQVWENPNTGVVYGALGGYDADGDQLTYSVVDPPDEGTVTLSNGTYTYKPSAELAASGGTDSFTVAIDDGAQNPWHIHGFGDALEALGITGPSTATVHVTVAPVVQQPGVAATVGTPDPDTGNVVITVVGKPEGVGLTASDPSTGTLVDNKDGTWTYKPTPEARLAASQVGAPDSAKSVPITFTASNSEGDSADTTVGVPIAALTNVAVDQYTVDHPWNVAIGADGKAAYVTSIYNGTVTIIDTATGDVVKTFPIGASSVPGWLAVSPNGALVYVANFTTPGAVTVIDTDGNELADPIAVGDNSRDVAFSPDGLTAYTANTTSNTISVIDVASGDVTTLNLPAGVAPRSVVAGPSGTNLYVINSSGDANSVAVINASDGSLVDTIPVGDGAFDLALSQDGTLYVSNTVSDTVSVIDTGTNKVTDTVDIAGGIPRALAVRPDGSTVYVTVDSPTANDSVAVIDTASGKVTDTIAVGDFPNGVAVSPDGAHLYVTNTTTGTVSVISLGPSSTATPTTFTVPVATVATVAAPPPSYPAQVTATPVTTRSVFADVLSWAGLGTLASNTWVPDLPLPGLIQDLWQTTRIAHYTFLNSYPGAAPTQVIEDPETGDIMGALGGHDADGDDLTYTIVDEPAHGSVTLADGVYTYKPDADLYTDGGTDSFTFTVDDTAGNPWHIHGFGTVLERLGLTEPSTQTVTVTVPSHQVAPTLTEQAGPTNPDGGSVYTGTLLATDRNGGPLTVTVPNDGDTPYGHVDLDYDEATGLVTYTYRTDDAARLRAGQTGDAPADHFTVTVTDATGLTDSVDVVGLDALPASFGTVSNPIAQAGGGSIEAATASDGRVYVANVGDTNVWSINPGGGVAGVYKMKPAVDVLVPVAGGRVYGITRGASTVQVLSNGNLPTQVTPGISGATDAAANSDGSRVYLVSNTGTVYAIDTSTNKVVAQTTVSGPARGVAVEGDHVYVVHDYGTGSAVTVLDTSLDAPTAAPIPVGGTADSSDLRVVAAPNGVVYIKGTVNTTDGVIRVDTTTGATQTMLAGPKTSTVVLSPDGSLAYISTWEDTETGSPDLISKVYVVDTATNETLEVLDTTACYSDVAVSPAGDQIYLIQPSGNVSAISFGSSSV